MKEREEKGKMDAGNGKRRQQGKRPRRRRNREERGEGKEKLEREKQIDRKSTRLNSSHL